MGIALSDRVYIVEDDDVLREWLGAGLSYHDFDVSCFSTIRDFEDALALLRPGCVLADLRMPGGGAIDLLKHLVSRRMDFPVIVMTAYADIAIAVSAMKQGAVDFIEKPFEEDAIVELIHSVQRRIEGTLGRRQTDNVAEVARARVAQLTRREREVLDLLVVGQPNKVIAGNLGISTRTVEVFRARVLKKMQVRSAAQLVSLVMAAERDMAETPIEP